LYGFYNEKALRVTCPALAIRLIRPKCALKICTYT